MAYIGKFDNMRNPVESNGEKGGQIGNATNVWESIV